MRHLKIASAAALGLVVAGMSYAVAARRGRRIDLKGRVAIVTGGGRGLGLAITRELVSRGCSVAICGRDEEVIRHAVEVLGSQGADIFGSACDASDPEQVDSFFEAVLARFGMVDLLVNNAGQCFVGPVVELQSSDMDSAMRNIFWAHYHPTMAALPHFRRRGFGRIANVTSLCGKVPLPHQAAYVAGKYAATGWSQALAVELAKEDILVSTVTPPPLRNGAPLHAHFNGYAEQEFDWFARTLTSPISASSTDKTARVVVDALIHGDRERSVSFLSWFFSRAFGMAPGVVSRWLARVDARLPLPAASSTTSRMRLGADVARASSVSEIRALALEANAEEARYRP